MKIKQKAKILDLYVDDEFLEWFGDMEYTKGDGNFYSHTLEKPLNDRKILETIKPQPMTISSVIDCVLLGESGLFYCLDKENVLRVVKTSKLEDMGYDKKKIHRGCLWALEVGYVDFWSPSFVVYSSQPCSHI